MKIIYSHKTWKSLSRVPLFGTPWATQSMEFSRPEHWSEWVAFPFSRGSSQPRDGTQVSCIAGRFFTTELPGKPKNAGVGSLSFLQGIFPTQGLNQGLLYCRRILYQLSYQGTNHLVNTSQSTNFCLSPTAFTPARPTLLPVQEHSDCLLIRLLPSADRLESTPHLTE